MSRLGKKHFEMAYEVSAPDGERLVSGNTVQVWYDYESACTSRIPLEVGAAIRRWEGIPEGKDTY